MPASQDVTVKIHSIAIDGLPDMDALTGRVAFIFDGCVVSGWPFPEATTYDGQLWEADSDVGVGGKSFAGVTHWIEFPETIKNYEKEER